MNRRRAWVIVTVAALVAVGLTASAGATGARAVKVDPKGILRFGQYLDASGAGGVISLDPTSEIGSPINTAIARLIYDNLVRKGPGGEALPGLATAWKVPDGQTVELTLRKGVKFQDGTKFDADAVKFSLARTRDSGNPTLEKNFSKIDAIDVVAPDVVRIHLNTPVMANVFADLKDWEGFIVSPTAVQKAGDAYAKQPVGAGPYRLKEFVPEERISLRKYRGFWERSGWKLAGIDFSQVAQGPPAVTALRAEQVDMVLATDQAMVDALRGQPGITVSSAPSNASVQVFAMCVTTPPFDKLEVRQAISYAIDRQEINHATTGGSGVITDLPWTRDSVYYAKDVAGRYPHNPKKAKQLLAKAGLPNGFSFDLMIFPAPSFVPPAEVIQQQLKDVGIKVNIVQASNYVQQLLVDNQAPATVVQSISAGLGKISFIDPSQPFGMGNWCHYTTPKLATAVAALKKLVGDVTAEKEQWRAVEKVIMDEVPIIFLFFLPVTVAYGPHVGGVKQIYGASGEGPDFRTIFVKKGG